jgi:hypothetical protein
MAASPDCQEKTAYLDGQADGDENLGGRQVASREPRDRDEEKQQGGVRHQYMQSARRRRFGLFPGGRVLRRNFPVNAEETPDGG